MLFKKAIQNQYYMKLFKINYLETDKENFFLEPKIGLNLKPECFFNRLLWHTF